MALRSCMSRPRYTASIALELSGARRITRVALTSKRGSASSNPTAEPTPAPYGTITVGMPIERAIRAACRGPAPPKAIKA
jgi:hypothetical protein